MLQCSLNVSWMNKRKKIIETSEKGNEWIIWRRKRQIHRDHPQNVHIFNHTHTKADKIVPRIFQPIPQSCMIVFFINCPLKGYIFIWSCFNRGSNLVDNILCSIPRVYLPKGSPKLPLPWRPFMDLSLECRSTTYTRMEIEYRTGSRGILNHFCVKS